MKTNSIIRASASAFARAARLLVQGRLVAFPTETVYGLGASAFNRQAIKRIFEAKGRPADNPLIVHIAAAGDLAKVCSQVPDLAWKLARKFWPGPLTLVLPKHPALPLEVTGGRNTVAVRVPDHPAALHLLKAFGGPIAAPSANLSGRPSPTAARHVFEDLGDSVDLILDGGVCRHGIESTVLDLSGAGAKILREGAVPREAIEKILGRLESVSAADLRRAASPGMKYRHYAPHCRVRLFRPNYGEAPLEVLGRRTGIICRTLMPRPGWCVYFRRVAGPLCAYARFLFAGLREAEHNKVEMLWVEAVAAAGIGAAIMDRLTRASEKGSSLKREVALQ